MDEMRKEKLVELLNSDSTDEQHGADVCRELGSAFNCFGSYSKMMAELNDALTEYGKDRLKIYICCAAMSLARSYAVNGCTCWDDRKKASEQFAYENEATFKAMFEEITGFVPEIVDNTMSYYPRAINRAQWRDRQDMLGFLSKWADEHSTIKQAMFGGYVRGVLGNTDACFPFI